MERKINCKNQQKIACNGCEVATEVAKNLMLKPNEAVVASIKEITLQRCPEGTSFRFIGNLLDLVSHEPKIIQLRPVNGEPDRSEEALGAEAAGL